jgi:hypothetical protein
MDLDFSREETSTVPKQINKMENMPAQNPVLHRTLNVSQWQTGRAAYNRLHQDVIVWEDSDYIFSLVNHYGTMYYRVFWKIADQVLHYAPDEPLGNYYVVRNPT